MITKHELIQRTDALLEKLRGEQINFIILLFLPNSNRRVDASTEMCIDFQRKVAASENDDELYELYKEFYILERLATRRAAMLNVLPSILILYVVFAAVFLLLTKVDISSFIEQTLDVKAPEKLITLGVAGAFVYLASNGLIRAENEKMKSQFSSVLNLSIRLSLAIIVPIILVVLFFNADGSKKELSLSPELLSFACGYSAKLVVEFFNKVVEKGSKIISTL